ncbi:Vitamin B12 import ATP-binding protein BtuD [bioreactor metagenome]|uniref:Vitamin B12 import ATP-binding protein BtuD n=1 Tax=bioreactor metagenome TaxID=1076179 RepID=A0A645IF96_9ZZZZ
MGIDAVSEKKIFSILQELRAEGKTILIVHHDLHKVTEYFDEVILLNRELIASGTVQETFTSNNLQLAYGEVIGQLVKGEQA